jgi:hypothetical protein
LRQGFYGGKGGNKTPVIWNNRCDLGLLEHDLGNPNMVRIAGIPPRQLTFFLVVPVQQAFQQFGPDGISFIVFWFAHCRNLIIINRRNILHPMLHCHGRSMISFRFIRKSWQGAA